jgi:predicted DNA-binding protein with PD1-like motif
MGKTDAVILAWLWRRRFAGPEVREATPVPHFESFDSAWEVFGMATIYPSSEGPKLHMHSALGRGREALAGCVREKATVYLVIEAVLFEFSGLSCTQGAG